jgi:MscS family membrane protein
MAQLNIWLNMFSLSLGAVEPVKTQNEWTQLLFYKFHGNEIWRFGLLLGVILVTLMVGRIVKFLINRSAGRLKKKEGIQLSELFLKSLSRPASVAVFAAGIYLSRLCMRFATETQPGFNESTQRMWIKISSAVAAIAVAYFIYRLVDIVEHYLKIWTGRTRTTLDDMLVPVIRKSLRIFIVAVSILFIADNILEMDLTTVLAAAGVGGLAVALAAQETVANFFGSVNIFADRPFQVGDRVRVGNFDGPVEDVGFRSTRIRTLDGHLITVPNSKISNEMVENISRRPFIKRVANITITYDTQPDKVEKAVQIIKDVLSGTEEVNRNKELVPRVYFNEFNDWALNILMIYWVTPPDYWMFQETNQKVNLAIMRAFEDEGIEFAFPSQTLYVKKDDLFS